MVDDAALATDLTSVAAQQLFFGHSTAGDLTPLFSGWFDTESGAKGEAASYRRIAGAIGRAPANILFLSNMVAEVPTGSAWPYADAPASSQPGVDLGE